MSPIPSHLRRCYSLSGHRHSLYHQHRPHPQSWCYNWMLRHHNASIYIHLLPHISENNLPSLWYRNEFVLPVGIQSSFLSKDSPRIQLKIKHIEQGFFSWGDKLPFLPHQPILWPVNDRFSRKGILSHHLNSYNTYIWWFLFLPIECCFLYSSSVWWQIEQWLVLERWDR